MLAPFRFLWRLLAGFADFVRKLLSIVLLFVLIAVLIVAMQGAPAPEVEEGVALVIAPSGLIVEYDDTDPRERVLDEILGEPPAVMPMADLTTAIEAATDDARIKLLFLKLDEPFVAGQAQLEELGRRIEDFRAAGKPVHAWAPVMDQQSYFLAAHADRIAIDPLGAVFLEGFEVDRLYFAEALESLGVTMHVFREGAYKSAVEPFIRNDMSVEARENAQRWLTSLWSLWKSRVASLRGQGASELQQYADELVANLEATDGDLAQVALQQGLVSAVEPLAGVRSAAAEVVGRDAEHGSFRQIWQGEYLRAVDREGWPGRPEPADAAPAAEVEVEVLDDPRYIALVHVQGEIVDGEGLPGQAGGLRIRDLIEQATRDDNVAALILRVDSPGGSVAASEDIRRALNAFKASGRPVVASMGSVAASGGYWVSMDANRIVAAPSTITGSIGVFGLVPNLAGTFDKLGVHPDGVGTTVWAGALNPARPLSEPAQQALTLVVRHDYRLFIESVAEARGMTPDAVEAVASGQVWSGVQAVELGLVDELGHYARAAAIAAELAGLPADAPVELFAPEPDIRVRLLEQFSSRLQAALLPAAWNSLSWQSQLDPLLQRALQPLNPGVRGTLAHCLCATPAWAPPRAQATASTARPGPL